MKSRVSSLNPYAASFVPLAKQKPYYKMETSKKTCEDSYSSETKAPSRSPEVTKQSHQIPGPGGKELLSSEDCKKEGHKIHGSYDSDFSIPNGMTEKQYLDEATEMDLAYLATLFPGLSDQSLAYVYSANGDDLDASVDMLKLLEYPEESSQHLPDTLDIGDVPQEFKSPADVAALKLKEPICAKGESSGSSSTGAPP
ncbi:Ubiquitin system component Cue [Macleaya cordata]|uniref:Ubiquitin system component Cue n=1 Tax=Macleaya cordata TaxID=56857 RepID=A0A200PNB3_MACCD|nr:Ubiquitin system component Cue [Macleaya cordata]